MPRGLRCAMESPKLMPHRDTRGSCADVRTTLKVYAHVIPQSQRESVERIANRSIGTKLANGTRAIAECVDMKENW
jgi:hypothetical protein